jgi:rare lipoprotein A (peptidoglycan hydrolase)
MRPHLNLRARHAATALGALCLAISLAALPGVARSSGTPAGHAAIAADIAPGKSRLNVLAGGRASVHGRVLSGAAGRAALLQRRSGQGWSTIDRATTRAGGGFGFAFRPQQSGSARLRVLVDAARREIGRLNVYRHAAVSWYGPGLYGNKLSCGGRLTPGTLGVAHKTLPCGARVTLRRGDRVIRVRVVDRGPYVGGREFDLTSATRAKLHFGGVGSLLVAS